MRELIIKDPLRVFAAGAERLRVLFALAVLALACSGCAGQSLKTGVYSSAFIHPSAEAALNVNLVAYLTFDKVKRELSDLLVRLTARGLNEIVRS